MNTQLASFLIAALCTMALTPAAIWLAHKTNAVAIPNSRSMHKTPMPSIGGLSIYAGFMISLFLTLGITPMSLAVCIGASLMVAIGLVDDMKELSPRIKFLGQVAVALIPVLFGTKIEFISNPFGEGMLYLGVFGIPLTVLWTVSVINVINFIDGLDGLCAGVSSIAALAIGYVAMQKGMYPLAVMSLALAGAAAGFLKYNFNPAKTFMGDTGSMFLGYVLSVISISGAFKGAATIALTIPILVLGVPIFDTAFAILRRCRRGQPFYVADKEHLHHRLVAMGLSTRAAVLTIYGISALLGTVAVVVSRLGEWEADALYVGVCALLVIGAYKMGIVDLRINDRYRQQRHG